NDSRNAVGTVSGGICDQLHGRGPERILDPANRAGTSVVWNAQADSHLRWDYSRHQPSHRGVRRGVRANAERWIKGRLLDLLGKLVDRERAWKRHARTDVFDLVQSAPGG